MVPSTNRVSGAVQGHLREGKCHLSLGNAKAASRCFRKVLELEPSNRDARHEVRISVSSPSLLTGSRGSLV